MDADARGESKVGKCVVVSDREVRRVSRIFEQKEEAVGTSNLTAAVVSNQAAGQAVVQSPNFRSAGVTEALDQACAVHHVGEEEDAHGHASGTRCPLVSRQRSRLDPTADGSVRTMIAKANTDQFNAWAIQRH
jgi:hypothetical protein